MVEGGGGTFEPAFNKMKSRFNATLCYINRLIYIYKSLAGSNWIFKVAGKTFLYPLAHIDVSPGVSHTYFTYIMELVLISVSHTI